MDKEELFTLNKDLIPIYHFCLYLLNELLKIVSLIIFKPTISFQSADTKHHSTEYKLLAVHDHIIKALSQQSLTALCLLDFSAAFDTVDHSIVLDRLSSWFGFNGRVLSWLESYSVISSLCHKYQLHSICSVFSTPWCSTRLCNWFSLIHTLHYSPRFPRF